MYHTDPRMYAAEACTTAPPAARAGRQVHHDGHVAARRRGDLVGQCAPLLHDVHRVLEHAGRAVGGVILEEQHVRRRRAASCRAVHLCIAIAATGAAQEAGNSGAKRVLVAVAVAVVSDWFS